MPQKVDAVTRKSDDANKNHSNVRREDTSTVLPESGRAGGGSFRFQVRAGAKFGVGIFLSYSS